MKYFVFIVFAITFLISGNVYSQNAGKHVQRLVGEMDQGWIDNPGKSIPVYPIVYSYREAQGFNSTSFGARLQASLNNPWFFYRNEGGDGKSGFTEIQLPHHFEKNRHYNSAWYVSKYLIRKRSDKRYFLKLNRIDLISVIYVNGEKAGSHIGSYTPFEVEITDHLIRGENVFALFVYDKSGSVNKDRLITQVGPVYMKAGEQGFNLSGGIDDIPVLEVREKTFISDIFIKTSTRNKEIEIEYEISSNENINFQDKLTFEILKWPDGEKVELNIPEVDSKHLYTGLGKVKTSWGDADYWSPDQPNLYVLRTVLQKGNSKDILETRFGFREFWIQGRDFMLNGIPTRLRGESHYHPMSHGVDFHREVFRMHKETFGSNACRVHAFMPHPDIFLGADEAGILIIDQSAVWSVNGQLYAKGGEELLNNLENEYEEWVRRDRNCPSVVIWDVENEMLRFNYDLHLPWVSRLPGFVNKFDNTRPVNFSGAGWFSKDQDMVSLHMQDNYTRILTDWNKKGTRPLITGEFWVGARADQRLPAAPEIRSVQERYVEEAATYERNILEMRYLGISGFMPFRISILGLKQIPHSTIGYNFTPPDKLEKEKRSEDVIQKIRHALQPVSVFFWPRETYSDANKAFQRELVLCNDSEDTGRYEVEWKWDDQLSVSETVEMMPGKQKQFLIRTALPPGTAKIIAVVKQNNELVSTDTILVNPIQIQEKKTTQTLQIFNNDSLAKRLSGLGYHAFSNKTIPGVEENHIWVIPEHTSNRELEGMKKDILNYLSQGGNILCLKQDQMPTWFPVRFQFWSADLVHLHTYEAMGWSGLNKDLRYAKYATILAPSHPVFTGIQDPSLHLWNKYDGRVADDVYSRPSGIGKYEQGNWRPLAASAKNTQMSLVEIFYGKGKILACQLHVIENLENPQAMKILDNMLTYLSGEKKENLNRKVLLAGDMTAENIAELTGANQQSFLDVNSEFLLAFEGADVNVLKRYAEKGGTVVVFSDKVSERFEGVVPVCNESGSYVASKVNEHYLLSGISSGNFKKPILNGFFKSIPENAIVLLQGFKGRSDFWSISETGPVMISLPYGKGEITLSTINITEESNNSCREFLRQIITNIGVPVSYSLPTRDIAFIKLTVPINVDGKLNEWLDDMDDRNVSQYVHAQPIFLTSQHTVEGPAAFDLRLSGINYFLWNKEALHIAGVIFTEEKTPTSMINFDAKKEYSQQVFFNDDIINITLEKDNIQLKVNGISDKAILIKKGQMNSKYMTDATKLQFSYINSGGEIATLSGLVGETFELKIPWEYLISVPDDGINNVMINLCSKERKLQVPITGDSTSQSTWLEMRMIDYSY